MLRAELTASIIRSRTLPALQGPARELIASGTLKELAAAPREPPSRVPNLTRVRPSLVRFCRQLTDPSIIAIAHNCKGLEKLNVTYASPRAEPPSRVPNLTRADPLSRQGLQKLTDPSIIAIADNCKGLKELNPGTRRRGADPLPALRISRASPLSRQELL